MRWLVGLCVVALGVSPMVWAEETPVAVSPGGASEMALVEGRCPTFSWGAVSGAAGYELAVYALGRDDEQTREAIRRQFQGTVTSWTPDLGQCLERGARYAWRVRAANEQGASDWSAPNLFEVMTGPDSKELEEAVAVIRRFFEVAASEMLEHKSNPETAAGVPGGEITARRQVLDGSEAKLAAAPGVVVMGNGGIGLNSDTSLSGGGDTDSPAVAYYPNSGCSAATRGEIRLKFIDLGAVEQDSLCFCQMYLVDPPFDIPRYAWVCVY